MNDCIYITRYIILRVIVFTLSVFLLCASSSYVHFKETDQMDLNDV